MMRYFLELGCKVAGFTAAERDRARLTAKEVSGRRMARLQLPLEFPKVRTAGKGGRR
jgi:DNA-directed RNA polymerase I subunit RPA49